MSIEAFGLAIVVVGYIVHRLALDLPLPPGSVGQKQDDMQGVLAADANPDDRGRSECLPYYHLDGGDHIRNRVNVDGTPMLNDHVDINGNTFGVTDDWLSNDWLFNEDTSHDSNEW